MKKQGKKWMLVALALLAMVMVALPLVGCKNDSVSEPVKYTVKFNKGENTEFTGTVPEDITVVSGTTLTGDQLEDLDDTTSYTFDGWHDGENKAKAGYEVKKNVTLTAKWTKKGTVANVSFDPKDRTVDAGTKVTLTTETEGATIWYHLGDEQWQEYTADTEIIINADTTITAMATKADMLPSGEFSASYHIHSFDETKWESDATDHWHPATCEHKDLKGSFAAHSFDWEVQTPSTDTKPGTLAGECTVCNLSTTKDIPVGFAYVKGGTIEGAALPWNPTENYEKGVFIAGRTVTLSDFFIGKYEVTQAEYASVMANQKVKVNETERTLNANPSNFPTEPATDENQGDRLPVENVSWYDAVWYCNALSEKAELEKAYNIKVTEVSESGEYYSITGATVTLNKGANGYRLPTEAEWEYAARGGNQSKEAWNYKWAGTDDEDSLQAYAWYGNSDDKTHEVGKKTANSLGLYDMSGNVEEWCWDRYDDDPKAGDPEGTSSVEDPTGPETGPSSGSDRVIRGGGWGNGADGCSVSYRHGFSPRSFSLILGFRVVRPSSK